MAVLNPDTPVYTISVAARLTGLHPQTLRQYDRLGLVSPARVSGRNRLYSTEDIEKLTRISGYSNAGVSLVSIMRIMELEEEVRRLTRILDQLHAEKRKTALVLWNKTV